MDTETLYRVVFAGRVKDGEDVDQVKERLAIIYKTTPEKVERLLFRGKKVIVKKDTTLHEAEKLKMSLERKTGAIFSIEKVAEKFSVPDPQEEADSNSEGKAIEGSSATITQTNQSAGDEPLYNAVFYGDLIEGYSEDNIKANLAEFFNVPPGMIDSMLQSSQRIRDFS